MEEAARRRLLHLLHGIRFAHLSAKVSEYEVDKTQVLSFGSAKLTLLCTRLSRPVVDASAPAIGSGIGGGLELRGVGR